MINETEAWVQDDPKTPLQPRTVPVEPIAGDVIVEVVACGVCHTDLGFLDGSVNPRGGRPLVPGHEVSGTVVWGPTEHQQLVGKQVIVPAVWPCGHCDICRAGRENACQSQRMPGNDVRGGFARHLAAPAACLAVLRQPVERERLEEMSVIADAVSTPYEAVVRSGLAKDDLAIVVGAGGVGGFLVQLAAARGARVLVLDVDQERLDLAARHGAAATQSVRDMGERDVRDWVRRTAKELGTPRWGWKIFETSGTAAGQRTAYDQLVPAATLMVVGFTRDRVELRLSNLMAFDAAAIGVWGCRPSLYPEVVELTLSGKLVLGPYVERRPLGDVNTVIDDIHAGRMRRRAVLVPRV